MTKKEAPTQKSKKSGEKQQELGLKMGVGSRISGFLYRFRKVEAILGFAPFWRDSLVWFVVSFEIFSYVILFFNLYNNLDKLPSEVPFLYFYPEGELQLVDPINLMYLLAGSAVITLVNSIIAARIFNTNRNEAKLLLLVDMVKTLFFGLLLFKVINITV